MKMFLAGLAVGAFGGGLVSPVVAYLLAVWVGWDESNAPVDVDEDHG